MKDLLKISIAVLACVLMSFNTHSQRLYLDEIIELREMDTTQLKIFCESKGFKLKKVEADAWRAVITYQSVSDSSISFLKTIPTGKTLFNDTKVNAGPGVIYYYFADKSNIKDFKKEMKEKKFKYHRTNSSEYGGNLFVHNQYRTAEDEIDLASDSLLGRKTTYCLMYYRRPN